MTLYNPEAYEKSKLWKFENFNECWEPTNIQMSDLDGIVERKGHFLVVEFKQPSVTLLPMGQLIMFQQLNKLGCFTILIIYGEPNIPERYEIWQESGLQEKAECHLDGIKFLMKNWFDKVNKKENLNSLKTDNIVQEEKL